MWGSSPEGFPQIWGILPVGLGNIPLKLHILPFGGIASFLDVYIMGISHIYIVGFYDIKGEIFSRYNLVTISGKQGKLSLYPYGVTKRDLISS